MKHKYLIFFFIMLISTVSPVYSKPSFDCSKASIKIEKLICQAGNSDLQELDKQLSIAYRGAKKSNNVSFIKRSQRKWLKYRNEVCQNKSDYMIKQCLQTLYQSRINELNNDLITYPVLMTELPYKFNIGDRLSGQLKYLVTTEQKNDIGAIETFYKLVLINDKGEKLIWSAVGYRDSGGGVDAVDLKLVNIHLYKNNDIVFEVQSHRHGGHSTAGSVYNQFDRAYITYGKSGELFNQGEIRQGQGGRHFSRSDVRWGAGDSLYLSVMSSRREVGDFSYIKRSDNRRIYTLNFSRPIWSENQGGIIKDLENSEPPTEYINLYNKIDSVINTGVVRYRNNSKVVESCVEKDIDWVMVAKGVDYWLSFSLMAKNEGISYDQAYYTLPILINHTDKYTLTGDQLALAKGLNYYREKIESVAGWKEKLDNSTKNPDSINPETMQMHGLPIIENKCTQMIYLSGYSYIKLDKWLYTFWSRRYKDNSYDIAKYVINSALQLEK